MPSPSYTTTTVIETEGEGGTIVGRTLRDKTTFYEEQKLIISQ
jgi:hypothetical protein